MNYLKGYGTNPQVRKLHNVKAVQSREGWQYPEALKAIEDARARIAYEFCETLGLWNPIDCGCDRHGRIS